MIKENQLDETILDEELDILSEELETQELNEMIYAITGYAIGVTLGLIAITIKKQIRIHKLIKGETDETKRKQLKSELNKESMYEIKLRKKILDSLNKTEKAKANIKIDKNVKKEKEKVTKLLRDIKKFEDLRKVASEYRTTAEKFKQDKKDLKKKYSDKRSQLNWKHFTKFHGIKEQYVPSFDEFINEKHEVANDESLENEDNK
jgi:hypothetical protein